MSEASIELGGFPTKSDEAAQKRLGWRPLVANTVRTGFFLEIVEPVGRRRYLLNGISREHANVRYWQLLRVAIKLKDSGREDEIAQFLASACRVVSNAEDFVATLNKAYLATQESIPESPSCDFCESLEAKTIVGVRGRRICASCAKLALSVLVNEQTEQERDAALTRGLLRSVEPYQAAAVESGGVAAVVVENLLSIREFCEANEDRLKALQRLLEAR